MTEQLAESLLHREHRVLGRVLRPFTFWHAWMLDFAQSPYGGAEVPITPAEVIFAVEVLRREPGVPGDAVKLPELAWWNKGRTVKRVLREGVAAVHEQLGYYFADYHAEPLCWRGGDGKPVKSHWCLYSVAVLMRHGRKTEREAWATQVGFGKHLLLALAEAGGHEVQLVTEAEREALAEAGY